MTATPLATQAAYEQAVKLINKEVSLPGFRKGKAPAATIIKQFSSAIDKEWRDILLNTAFHELLKLTETYPFTKNSVKNASIKSISKEDGAVLSVSYECSPNIPAIDPAAISINVEELKPVTEDEMAEAIKNFQLMHATWQEVTDRPAAEGDYIYIDVKTVEEPQEEIYKDQKVELKQGRLDDWLRRLLLGMNTGESREGVSEPSPATAESEQQPAFVPTRFNVTLKKIETPVLPAVDEELAKLFGKETVEEFKESVENLLNKQAKEAHQQDVRHRFENALLDQYVFDVPGSLVAEDLKARKDAIAAELKEHGMQGEALKMALAHAQNGLEEKVARDLRMLFITQEVARLNKIGVEQEEIMQEFMQQMYLSGSGRSIIHKGMEPAEVRSKLHITILMNKVLDLLLQRAGIAV